MFLAAHEKPNAGHRNSRTVKGVSFLGESDEYVMSGSDDGHIYIWTKSDGILRQWLPGDLHVVNCLEPHPTHPMSFATSGKLCVPDSEKLALGFLPSGLIGSLGDPSW